MINFIKSNIKNLAGSFNTQPGGFSSRKLTAFVTMMCVIYIHHHFVDQTNAMTAMLYDMVFILLLFGIVTIDQLYKFKTGGGQITTDKSKDPEKEEIKEEKVEIIDTKKTDVG